MTKESQALTVKPEGEVVFKTETDGTVVLSSDKPVSININEISSIGVRNIIDIKSYQLERLEHSTKHFIDFHNGGTVNFEYSDDGKIINLLIRNLLTTVYNGELMIETKK